jgi:hypothetical protein
MKKLLLVLFVAGFMGLAFAYSPVKVTNSTKNGVVLMEDTTKVTKKTTTKKGCTAKRSCCKSKCDGKKTTKKKEKKN